MIRHVELDPGTAPALAAFTRVAGEFDMLTTTTVRRAIFSDPDPQIVVGVYNGALEAVGVAVVRDDRGWIKFLAVHPRCRRQGIASGLLQSLETFCQSEGARSIEMGACAPYYVMPGIDVRYTEAICFFEAAGFERRGEAVNLSCSLRDVPEPDRGVRPAEEADLDGLRSWVTDAHPNWLNEMERAVRLGTCIVHEQTAFACYDVNREGWVGPMATHPRERGGGYGRAVLLGALHELRNRGHERAEVAWAQEIAFYVRAVGARINRVFWWYRKAL